MWRVLVLPKVYLSMHFCSICLKVAAHGMTNKQRLVNLRVDLPLGECANLDLHLCSGNMVMVVV